MCSFKFPAPSELSLLNVVAECISKHFPELEKFMEHVSVIEKAAKLNFSSLASMVRRLESGHNRVLVEFQYGGTTPMVSEFIENSEPQIVEIKDSLVVTK
ncbi:unnamed protein product, partial [Anisakis simplex]|uniref:FH2 domain-containing protein n=1 Tax=Anisakis simplex TaxID=6269 RepID=A0A0M3JH41_ANISI